MHAKLPSRVFPTSAFRICSQWLLNFITFRLFGSGVLALCGLYLLFQFLLWAFYLWDTRGQRIEGWVQKEIHDFEVWEQIAQEFLDKFDAGF